MSLVRTRRDLLEAVDKLVRKPGVIEAKDLHGIVIGLSTILTDCFGEAVLLTPMLTGRTPVVPVDFPKLSEEEREQERLNFVAFLQLQPGILNVGYCPTRKKFLLQEDQAAWEAWIYRALLQRSVEPQLYSKELLERFNAYFMTTPKAAKVHETVMSFWHPEQQRFLIDEIQQAFEQWSKDNK